MADEARPRPDQEGFGEAELGEAQSSNPPPDPEYLEDQPHGEAQPQEGGPSERGAEAYGDEDAGPTLTPEQIEEAEQRDQAEG